MGPPGPPGKCKTNRPGPPGAPGRHLSLKYYEISNLYLRNFVGEPGRQGIMGYVGMPGLPGKHLSNHDTFKYHEEVNNIRQ